MTKTAKLYSYDGMLVKSLTIKGYRPVVAGAVRFGLGGGHHFVWNGLYLIEQKP